MIILTQNAVKLKRTVFKIIVNKNPKEKAESTRSVNLYNKITNN